MINDYTNKKINHIVKCPFCKDDKKIEIKNGLYHCKECKVFYNKETSKKLKQDKII